jgi:DNA-directed RNA polymerase specialized sigma24 family protein
LFNLNPDIKALPGESFSESWFNWCYNLFFDEMLLTAFDFLGNQQEAEDIVSGVFEKIWRSKDRCLKDDFLNDQYKLKCYLSMAIKNACIDLHRKKKRQTAAFINFSRFQPLWKRPDVYDKFEEEALRLLMLELSKREKEVILLFLRGQNNAAASCASGNKPHKQLRKKSVALYLIVAVLIFLTKIMVLQLGRQPNLQHMVAQADLS